MVEASPTLKAFKRGSPSDMINNCLKNNMHVDNTGQHFREKIMSVKKQIG